MISEPDPRFSDAADETKRNLGLLPEKAPKVGNRQIDNFEV